MPAGSSSYSCRSADGTEVNGCAHDRQKENGIVVAVDSHIAGMIEQQRRQEDLDRNDVGRAACRLAIDQPALEKLNDDNRKNDQLFVDFR